MTHLQVAESDVYWPAVAVLTSLITTAAFVVAYGRQRRATIVVLFAAAAAGWAGASGGAMLLNALSAATGSASITQHARHHFSLDGALWSAVGGGYLVARRVGVDLFRTADLAAPGLALGVAVARWGCFQQGCCYGRETGLPWGVTVRWGSPAYLAHWIEAPAFPFAGPLKVHPTQLYELAAAVAIAAVAAVALRGRLRPGAVAASAWSSFFSWRLINDALRAPATLTLPWTVVLHATAVIAGLWILRQRFAHENATSPRDA